MTTIDETTVISKSDVGEIEVNAPLFRSREERLAAGKALRDSVPRASHNHFDRPSERSDPIEVLKASNSERLQELVPIRYGRMLRSPFTFLRGSAGLMASDLAGTSNTGIRVQACGDCHLMNFGLFATPERKLIFDINDFDETLPAPWEWDVKRLATSFVVCGRDSQLTDKDSQGAAIECARAYRENLRKYSKMSPLEILYDSLDAETIIEMAPNQEIKKRRKQMAEKARRRIADNLFPKIATQVGGRHRLIDQPPVVFHITDAGAEKRAQESLAAYRLSLSDERRTLFDCYRLEDIAVKVVGIGSVGTRCYVGLFFAMDNQPLLLQFKEACHSVLEPYAGKSVYTNHGQRVVMGQRLMQSSSDVFLGCMRSPQGFDFFGRQLRDMKMSPSLEVVTPENIKLYAEICGLTLARAHAKSGNAALISGYLGNADAFDQAIGEFALAYADQNERDHSALVTAVNAGKIEALVEEDL